MGPAPVGVPHRGLQRGGVGNFLLQILRRKARRGLRQGKAVIFHVVAYGALYLLILCTPPATAPTMFTQKISCMPVPVMVQLFSFAILSRRLVMAAAVVHE